MVTYATVGGKLDPRKAGENFSIPFQFPFITVSLAKSCIPATGRSASCNEIHRIPSGMVIVFMSFLCGHK